ncbi:MAG: S8 family serine peptidase, partial [Myxococcales bacterium]
MLYPASYPSVISVAALDAQQKPAGFSQRNPQVDLAAPGVDIRSTVPFKAVNEVRVGEERFEGNAMAGSPTTDAVTAALVDGGTCGTVGAWAGRVVLCRRGEQTFQQKVQNVSAGGGRAAVIYNNVAGTFSGTLGSKELAIPAISVSQEAGAALQKLAGAEATFVSQRLAPASGYATWSGTSMAAPHVSGVAALVWGHNPEWSNAHVRAALERTARDVGAPARDDETGFGLVRAREALALLQEKPIGNVAPIAGFTASCRGLTCTFKSTSLDPDGEIASAAWTIWDVIASGTQVSWTFETAGTHEVKLQVTDAEGATAEITSSVTVCVTKPVGK